MSLKEFGLQQKIPKGTLLEDQVIDIRAGTKFEKWWNNLRRSTKNTENKIIIVS